MSSTDSILLTIKELAAALRRPRSYVQAMKRRGFRMSANRATLAEARAWLEMNPNPRAGERPRHRLAA